MSHGLPPPACFWSISATIGVSIVPGQIASCKPRAAAKCATLAQEADDPQEHEHYARLRDAWITLAKRCEPFTPTEAFTPCQLRGLLSLRPRFSPAPVLRIVRFAAFTTFFVLDFLRLAILFPTVRYLVGPSPRFWIRIAVAMARASSACCRQCFGSLKRPAVIVTPTLHSLQRNNMCCDLFRLLPVRLSGRRHHVALAPACRIVLRRRRRSDPIAVDCKIDYTSDCACSAAGDQSEPA
jgi:hypothetical protein